LGKGDEMIRLPLIATLFFLVGCTSSPDLQTSNKTIQMRHSAYLGKKIGLFVLGVGMPYAKRVSRDKVIYRWNSGNPLPYPRFDDKDDYWMDGECEIEIYTRFDGHIAAIYAQDNRAKNWDITACAKYLK
jgi:hypothetical protein